MNGKQQRALNEKIALFLGYSLHKYIPTEEDDPFAIINNEHGSGNFFDIFRDNDLIVKLLLTGVSVLHPYYSGEAGYKAVSLTPAKGLVEVVDNDLRTAVALCFAEANGLI